MNRSTIQVLDEIVLGEMAKSLLCTLGATGIAVSVMAFRADQAKLLDNVRELVHEALATELNLMRFGMASCDATAEQQEATVRSVEQKITMLTVGMLAKLSRGEPVDEQHAAYVASRERVKAAKTPSDKLRAFADMLEQRGQRAPSKHSA